MQHRLRGFTLASENTIFIWHHRQEGKHYLNKLDNCRGKLFRMSQYQN